MVRPLALVLLLSGACASFNPVQAQTLSTGATIDIPVGLTVASSLNFGDVARGGSGSFVDVVATGSTCSTSTGAGGTPTAVLATGSPTRTVGQVTVTGEVNRQVVITLNGGTSTATLTGSGGTISLTQIQRCISGTGSSTNSGTFNVNTGAGGSVWFRVGGRLSFSGTESGGTYSGVLPVTATYQ